MFRSVRLYDYIRSELIEYENAMIKIASYDDDVHAIISSLFGDLTLEDAKRDREFKKTWTFHYLQRTIKWQTIDLFKLKNTSIWMGLIDPLDYMYNNLDDLLTRGKTSDGNTKGTSEEIDTNLSESSSLSSTSGTSKGASNSSGRTNNGGASLNQDVLELDLDSTVLDYANTLGIQVNKQEDSSSQSTEGSSKLHGKTKSDDTSVKKDMGEAHTKTTEYDYELIIKHLDFLNRQIRKFDRNFTQVFL